MARRVLFVWRLVETGTRPIAASAPQAGSFGSEGASMKRKDRKRREEGDSDQLIPRDLRELKGEEDDEVDDFYQPRRDSGVRRHRGRSRSDKQIDGRYGE